MLLSIILDKQSSIWIHLKKFFKNENFYAPVSSCEHGDNHYFLLNVKYGEMSNIWFVAPRNKAW